MTDSLRELAAAFSRKPRRKDAVIDPNPPASLVTYKDPAGRFELLHPSTWQVSNVGGVSIRSREIGTFVRIDVVKPSADLWGGIVEGLERAGARVEMKHRPSGAPTRIHGTIDLEGVHFRWDAFAYVVSDGIAVLSLANVVDAKRGPTLERYEDRILATIRRHFVAHRRPA